MSFTHPLKAIRPLLLLLPTALPLVSGCGSANRTLTVTSPTPVTLAELPAGGYTGEYDFIDYNSKVTKIATFDVTVDAQQFLSGTLVYLSSKTPTNGTIVGGVVIADNWALYYPMPQVTIDFGDGSGPTTHTLIFEKPILKSGVVFVLGHPDYDAANEHYYPGEKWIFSFVKK